MKKNKNLVWLILILIAIVILFLYREDMVRGFNDGFNGLDPSSD